MSSPPNDVPMTPPTASLSHSSSQSTHYHCPLTHNKHGHHLPVLQHYTGVKLPPAHHQWEVPTSQPLDWKSREHCEIQRQHHVARERYVNNSFRRIRHDAPKAPHSHHEPVKTKHQRSKSMPLIFSSDPDAMAIDETYSAVPTNISDRRPSLPLASLAHSGSGHSEGRPAWLSEFRERTAHELFYEAREREFIRHRPGLETGGTMDCDNSDSEQVSMPVDLPTPPVVGPTLDPVNRELQLRELVSATIREASAGSGGQQPFPATEVVSQEAQPNVQAPEEGSIQQQLARAAENWKRGVAEQALEWVASTLPPGGFITVRPPPPF
ncbi:hypothetical protein M427DRAFT_47203 [Gonapodya prolifera JEL478]|uniref:Uncharacterized protein n=1 Tax=Gonapodya prolifera (strain JEL478) TaxID=1344416 RepID=A0A139A4M7_GONPJ|nr:hypothetical protein M427DRAFT_47203 [Gonapodya prolifera JEL478]|eukprot:KXS11333.1 hypothetical protein M427DRAFT_47203 [Gonapodya prolifera JEL478]